MTGMAAIALCAAFTSCSKDMDFEQMTPESVVESKYNAAFIKAFGQPAPDQTWGFGTPTKGITRNNGIDGAINVNGNMWTGAPEVEVPREVNAIYDYVKYTLPEMDRLGHVYSTTAPENLNGYFVTQVRNGLNNDNKDLAANNSWVTNEGSYMNHLQIAFNEDPSMNDLNGLSDQNGWNANDSGWEHINNFNASQNANWANDQSELHGNTKVENKGAHDFAYHNSLDSKYHNNWILVDGYYITSDHKYANYYYVCFDFESMPDGVKTEFSFSGKNDSGSYQTGYNGKVDGYYSSVNDILKAWEDAGITTFTGADGKQRNISEMKDITITGYEKGDKVVFPDDVHTDWIIRITKGAPTQIVNDYDGRIMAEDLSANESSDFDFNDVVFDYKVLTGQNKARVKLRAAGGTLELYVGGTLTSDGLITGGHEVHREFGVSINTMVNTGAGSGTKDPDPFEVDCADDDPINIKIWVKKSGEFHELSAHTGMPASKFNTDKDTDWCDEYISISNPYPDFATWVGDASTDWTSNKVPRFADQNLGNNAGAIKGRK